MATYHFQLAVAFWGCKGSKIVNIFIPTICKSKMGNRTRFYTFKVGLVFSLEHGHLSFSTGSGVLGVQRV